MSLEQLNDLEASPARVLMRVYACTWRLTRSAWSLRQAVALRDRSHGATLLAR